MAYLDVIIERDARFKDFITELADTRSRFSNRFERVLLFDGVRIRVLENMKIKVGLIRKDLGAQVASVNL